jgi:sugar lactone lactonase YvrE
LSRALVVAALLAACSGPPSNGFAVDVTVVADPTLASSVVGTIRGLSLAVSGAEQSVDDFRLPSGLHAGGERIVYRPSATAGQLTLSVTAFDDSANPVAYGSTTVILTAGQTVSATVSLTDMVPPPPDMGAPFVVTPTAATTTRLGSVAFSAAVPVAWSVAEPAGGSIAASGMYTAPAFAGTFHVVARALADPTQIARIPVEVRYATLDLVGGAVGGCGAADGAAGDARFGELQSGITSDNAGNLYVADRGSNLVRKVDTSGNVTTIAGQANVSGETDDTTNALNATFNQPHGIAVDAAGANVYVSDWTGCTIRHITVGAGTSTLAGIANMCGYAEATLGSNVQLNSASELVLSGTSLFFTDYYNDVLRIVDINTGKSTLLAGLAGTPGSGNAPPRFNSPNGLTTDGTLLYVASDDFTVRTATTTPTANTTTIAGAAGTSGYLDNTNGNAARFQNLTGITYNAGSLYVVDAGNALIRAVVSTGANAVTTLAGTQGVSGIADGNPATFSTSAEGIVASRGSLYVNDGANCTVRQVVISTAVTSTFAGVANQAGIADGAIGTSRLQTARAFAVDSTGKVYFSDTGNHTIRAMTLSKSGGSYTSTIITVAGTPGTPGFNNATGTAALFNQPKGLTLAGDGTLYIADGANSAIRKLDTASGAVSTVATLQGPPISVAIDETGVLYATTQRNTIVRLAPGEQSRELWGQANVTGSTDDIGSLALFSLPGGLVYDGARHLYVGDTNNQTIRRVDVDSGVVTTLAGTAGMAGYLDANGPAARFNKPSMVLLDGANGLLVGEVGNHVVRRIDLGTGDVTTLLGQSTRAGVKTGAWPASLNQPRTIGMTPTGELIIGDLAESVVLIAH